MTMREAHPQSLTLGAAAVASGHVGGGPCLVDEHEALWREIESGLHYHVGNYDDLQSVAVTGTTAYGIISAGNRCMGQNCHNNAQAPVFSTRQTFMAAMINKNSTSAYQFVVPNMPDQSYLLYKLRGTHLSVPTCRSTWSTTAP